MALKGPAKRSGLIFRNVSKRGGIKEEIEFMGPVRLREVEEAQQRIVSIIRKLDETGEIISRGGEDAIIAWVIKGENVKYHETAFACP